MPNSKFTADTISVNKNPKAVKNRQLSNTNTRANIETLIK
jgi:hypothetical protein